MKIDGKYGNIRPFWFIVQRQNHGNITSPSIEVQGVFVFVSFLFCFCVVMLLSCCFCSVCMTTCVFVPVVVVAAAAAAASYVVAMPVLGSVRFGLGWFGLVLFCFFCFFFFECSVLLVGCCACFARFCFCSPWVVVVVDGGVLLLFIWFVAGFIWG